MGNQCNHDLRRFDSLLWLSPGILVFSCFLLKVLAELKSGSWEPDLDYLMYTARQWLLGKPPWIFEFDDKLPLSYVFFLPAALAKSIRVYQLQVALIIMAGGIAVSYIFASRMRSAAWLPRYSLLPISFFIFGLFCYSIAFIPSSINTINSMAAAFMAISAALLLYIARRHFLLSLQALPWLLLGSMFAALSVSLRPYYLLASMFIVIWVHLATAKTTSVFTLLKTFGCWVIMISAWGGVFNILPYFVSGNLEALMSGLQILSQRLIPSSLAEMLKRQFNDVINLPELTFFAITSPIFLLALIFSSFGEWSFLPRPRDVQFWRSKSFLADVLFFGIFFIVSIEILILKKHYYPHYLQLFVPFFVVSMGYLLAIVTVFFQGLLPRFSRGLAVIACVLLLALLRVDFTSSAQSVVSSLLDERTAEFVTLQADEGLKQRLKRGFLYPESMSLHWKLDSSGFGFPNSYNFKLISESAWAGIRMPEYFNIPTTPASLCDRLLTKGPETIITKTDSISECLDRDPDHTYKLLPQVDHSLINLAVKVQKSSPYSLRIYSRVSASNTQ